MLVQCPNCGQKTALLNNTCEHCGCKTKTCPECGNIVKNEDKTCSYCGIEFGEYEKNYTATEKVKKHNNDVISLIKTAKTSKKPYDIALSIFTLLPTLPIIFCLFLVLGKNGEFLNQTLSLGVYISFFCAIFTNPIAYIINLLYTIFSPTKIQGKAQEINFDKNYYIKNLNLSAKNELMFDSSIALPNEQLQLVDILRQETDGSIKTKRILLNILCIVISPIRDVFALLGVCPIISGLLFMLFASITNESFANITVFMTPNIFFYIWLMFVAIIVIFNTFSKTSKKKNSIWVKAIKDGDIKVASEYTSCANTITTTTTNATTTKGVKKSKWIALLLCWFLGEFGAHKFYEGKVGLGVLYLFTFGLFGIGILVDFFTLLFKPNPYYVEKKIK